MERATTPFILRSIKTGHEGLKRLLIMSDPSRKLARWSLHYSELIFGVVHGTDVKHRAADALLELAIVESN